MESNSTLKSTPELHKDTRASLIFHYRDAPGYRSIAMSIVVLVLLIWILIWNWRRHKLSKDTKLGFIQSKCPLFTDTVLLLWGLGSGYGIIFAVKSPFYELFQVSTSVGIMFKGVGAILVGFLIGFIHVYYESENDYWAVKRSLSEMKRITFNHQKPKIYKCNFKDSFLLFWSLSSGYGIIFAIESYIYELFGLKSMIAYIIKPCVAILVGVAIGCVHFYYDILQNRFMENRTYSVVNDNKMSDDEFGIDLDNDTDKAEGDSDECIETNDCDQNDDIELTETVTALSDVLERTVTIDEFELKNERKRWRLNRSKTYTSNKAEKRLMRLNTM